MYVRVWDAGTGLPLTTPVEQKWVQAVQFSFDNRWIVTSSEDGTARIWNGESGLLLNQPLVHNASVHSAEFSPDGRWVVTASRDKIARVWDALTGLPVTGSLTHLAWVKCAHFSPDSQRIVTASYDRTVRIWDARTGAPLTEPLLHYSSVNSVQFSADAQRLVTVQDDDVTQIWDAVTGQPLMEPITCYRFCTPEISSDGARLLMISKAFNAQIWQIAGFGAALAEPLRHASRVTYARPHLAGPLLSTADTPFGA